MTPEDIVPDRVTTVRRDAVAAWWAAGILGVCGLVLLFYICGLLIASAVIGGWLLVVAMFIVMSIDEPRAVTREGLTSSEKVRLARWIDGHWNLRDECHWKMASRARFDLGSDVTAQDVKDAQALVLWARRRAAVKVDVKG